MKNSYLPEKARIVKIVEETPDTKTFIFNKKVECVPGQFMELMVFGYGEAPISISSHRSENLALTVRAIGNVTNALHRLKEGDVVGLRGPFGKGWPIEKAKGKNLLIITGGIGLAPLRPVIKEVERNRDEYGKVILLYGARNPELILYKKELGEWMKFIDVNVTVDFMEENFEEVCPAWRGDVGVVTTLLDKTEIPMEDNYAFVCGPPIMMKFTVKDLIARGFSPTRIYISLERHMKCGMGVCGRCQVSGHFVCKDGPVFNVSTLLTWKETPEEIEGVI